MACPIMPKFSLVACRNSIGAASSSDCAREATPASAQASRFRQWSACGPAAARRGVSSELAPGIQLTHGANSSLVGTSRHRFLQDSRSLNNYTGRAASTAARRVREATALWGQSWRPLLPAPPPKIFAIGNSTPAGSHDDIEDGSRRNHWILSNAAKGGIAIRYN